MGGSVSRRTLKLPFQPSVTMPAEAPWRMFEEGVRTRPAERCCLGPCSLELGRGVLYGAGMMAIVSLIATIVDIAR